MPTRCPNPQCRAINPDNARFCWKDGTSLTAPHITTRKTNQRVIAGVIAAIIGLAVISGYLIWSGLNQPPIAEILSPKSGARVSKLVQFNGRGEDPERGVVTYEWDFGDGTKSTEQNPLHTYTRSGDYTITLIVTDNKNLASNPATVRITVENKPPQAKIIASSIRGNAPLVVQFDGTGSTDPDGPVAALRYRWEFGDGRGISDKAKPTYEYANVGTYVVTLEVTDSDGAKSWDTTTIYVTATDDHGDNASNASLILVGTVLTGSIEHGGDIDFFKFHTQVGCEYSIETQLQSLGDSVLYLYDTNGSREITKDDDSGGGRASRITWRAPATSIYYIKVTAYGSDATGSYYLSVRQGSCQTPQEFQAFIYASQSTCAVGQAVEIQYRASQAPYFAYIIDIQGNNVYRLFPNHFESNNQINDTNWHTLPGVRNYQLTCSPPLGPERVQIIASTKRIPQLEGGTGAFPLLGTDPQVVEQQIESWIKATGAKIATARVQLQIVQTPDSFIGRLVMILALLYWLYCLITNSCPQ